MPKYFLVNRPPGYSHMPDGYSNSDGSLVLKEWQSQHGPVLCFGWVEYTDPLSVDQVWKWDFEPDDPVEWAHYIFWLFADRSLENQEYYEKDYVSAYKSGDLKTNYIPEFLLKPIKILSDENNNKNDN